MFALIATKAAISSFLWTWGADAGSPLCSSLVPSSTGQCGCNLQETIIHRWSVRRSTKMQGNGTENAIRMDHRCMLRLSAKARWFHHHQSWQWLPHGMEIWTAFFLLAIGDLKSVGCQGSSCFFPTCYYVSFLVLFLINMKWFLGCWLITMPLPRLCAIVEGRTTHSQTPGPTQDNSGANRCQNRQMDE